MPTNLDYFYFDVNTGMGTDSVFTLVERIEEGANPPPIEGYFLISDGTDFLLSDGTNLLLA